MFGNDPPALKQFIPTREAALGRLRDFIPKTDEDYRRTRNFDFGPADRSNISTLSPYLRHRLLTETEVADATLQRHSFRSAEKFLQEVFWRSYWKGYLENRSPLWSRYRGECVDLLARHQNSPTYAGAISGTAGIDCFDAWSRELTETGYLHNHARMWFASIWIFTLKLPWQLGADFFLRHLLDGDPASNTLSWRWVAGLHTKGKTYLARPSNIERYTGGRFAPAKELAETANPASEDAPLPKPNFVSLPPLPNTFESRTGLVLLDEELSDHCLDLSRFDAAIGLFHDSASRDLHLSESVGAFRRQALQQRLAAITAERGVPCAYACQDFAASLIDWARASQLDAIALFQPQVGPWGDAWPGIERALRQTGLTVHRFRHWWEEQLFPHATAGYFKLKKQLPRVIAELQSRAP